MTDGKNTMTHTIPWDMHRIPGFDYSKFIRVKDTGDGKKDVMMSLEGRKTWFRLACPSGGLVLNALRVTDAMAIFEARVFADANDRSPLSSFTATQKADKGTGDAYIRAAQDAALEEALKSAGFCLELSAQAHIAKGERTAAQSGQTADAGRPAEAPEEAPGPTPAPIQAGVPVRRAEENAPPQVDVTAQKEGNNTPPPVDKAAQQPKPQADSAPRPAPVGPQPHADTVPRPATVGPQPHAAPAPENKDAAPVVDINTRQPVAAGTSGAADSPAPAPDPAPAEASPEPAPVAYTADMTVDEITVRMTLEQAKAIKVPGGTCKGWTLEQVARDRPPSLKWLKFTAPFADNVLKAAAGIVLNDLELKKAG